MSSSNNKRKQPSSTRDEFTTILAKISTDLASLATLLSNGGLGEFIATSTSMTSSAPAPAPPTKKAKRDPNAPKPNLTSYIHFSREVRPKVEKENPKLTPNEVVSQVAKKWNSLTDNQKQKYKDIAAEDKIRFEKEMAVYTKKLATTNGTDKSSATTTTTEKKAASKKSNEKKPAVAAANKKQAASSKNKRKNEPKVEVESESDDEEVESDENDHFQDASSKNRNNKKEESSDEESSSDNSEEDSD